MRKWTGTLFLAGKGSKEIPMSAHIASPVMNGDRASALDGTEMTKQKGILLVTIGLAAYSVA